MVLGLLWFNVSFAEDLNLDSYQQFRQSLDQLFYKLDKSERFFCDDGIKKSLGSDAVLRCNVYKNLIKEDIKITYNHKTTNDRPKIKIITDPQYTQMHHSFGGYMPSTSNISVVVHNRNMADILRTLAHELVHHMQNLDDKIMRYMFDSEKI